MATEGKNHGKTVVIGVIMTLLIASVFIGGAVADDVINEDGTIYLESPNGNTNLFTNPNFTDGFTGWTQDGTGTASSICWGYNFAMSGYCQSVVGSDRAGTSYIGQCYISQPINMTNTDEITFQIALNDYAGVTSLYYSHWFGYIYLDDTPVKFTVDSGTTKYTTMNLNEVFGTSYTKGTYKTIHIKKSDLSSSLQTGTHTFKLFLRTGALDSTTGLEATENTADENVVRTELQFRTKAFTAMDNREYPEFGSLTAVITENNKNAFTNVVNFSELTNKTVTFTCGYTAGSPTTTYMGYAIDNSSSGAVTNWTLATSNPMTFQITPTSGCHTYYFWVKNDYGIGSGRANSIEYLGLTINAEPSSGDVGVDFLLKAEGDTETIYKSTNVTPVWSFKADTSGASWVQKYAGDTGFTWHSDSSGLYDVRFSGRTTNNKNFTVEVPDMINTKDAYIRWDATEYTTSDTATISWDFTRGYVQGRSYSMRVYTCTDSGGDPRQGTLLYNSAEHVTLSVPVGSLTIPCSYFISGYVTACIWDNANDGYLIHSAGIPIKSYGTLQVDITNNDVVWTTPTTISIYNETGDVLIQQQTNITTGTYTFKDSQSLEIPKRYTIKGVTEGYSQQTKYDLDKETGGYVRLDWTKGASEESIGTGAGSMYASTYVTFRIVDSGTGRYLTGDAENGDGCVVTAVAVQPTNPIDWIANLFGAAWGSKIQGTTLSGRTDDSGKITFAMFPVYRYDMTITVKGVADPFKYSFQPTELTTEEIISLPITNGVAKANASQFVITTVTKNDDTGVITVNYEDSSGSAGTGTTSRVVIKIYKMVDGVKTPTWGTGQTCNLEVTGLSSFSRDFAMQGKYSREDYYVDLDCYVTAFYEAGQSLSEPSVIRQYGLTFGGVRIPIGNIPDGLYLVFSFGILVMLGAIGTQVTSRFYAIVVAGVGLFLLWAGWMGALGVVGEGACVLAFIIAIIYYIAGGNQPQ